MSINMQRKKLVTTLSSFVLVRELGHSKIFDEVSLLLDTGESEAMSLAIELDSGLTVDEKKAERLLFEKE